MIRDRIIIIIASSAIGPNETAKNAIQNDSVGSTFEIGLNEKVSAEISVPKTGEIHYTLHTHLQETLH